MFGAFNLSFVSFNFKGVAIIYLIGNNFPLTDVVIYKTIVSIVYIVCFLSVSVSTLDGIYVSSIDMVYLIEIILENVREIKRSFIALNDFYFDLVGISSHLAISKDLVLIVHIENFH